MIVYSDRTEFVGAHVTPETKRELRKAAFLDRVSVSAWISAAIVERLENRPTTMDVSVDAGRTTTVN